jgi:hypothetical protein
MRRDLTGVEAALSSLRPAPTGVDRDRLMYLAGRAAAAGSLGARRPRASWLWPSATAASLLLAVTFATMWLGRGEPMVVYRDRPVAAPHASQRPSAPIEEEVEAATPRKQWRTDYLQLRRLVTTQGVDAIPEMRSAPASGAETLRWRSGFDRTLEELFEG